MLRPARRFRRMVWLQLQRQFADFQSFERLGRIPSKLFVLDLRHPKLLASLVDLVSQLSMLSAMLAAARLPPRTEIGKTDRDKQARK